MAIRRQLGVQAAHFNTGQIRSQRAGQLWKRGVDLEEKIFLLLTAHFSEPYVHNQSREYLSKSKLGRLDFVVYHPNGKFGVDVYFPDAERNRFVSNTAIKFSTYKNFSFPLYLVVGNPQIESSQLRLYKSTMKQYANPLIRLLTTSEFEREVLEIRPFHNPYS